MIRLAPWLESVWQDVRYGARSLRRSPGFTITALATLTIGVALNTTMFALVNGFLLKPWPLPDPGQIFRALAWSGQRSWATGRSVSSTAYRFLRDHAASIDLVAIAQTGPLVTMENDVATVPTRYVSGNYFDVLRVPLALGRGFRRDEDVAGSPIAVAVIGHAFWRDRLESSPEAIGKTVRLNDVAFEVIGVAAPGATDSPLRGPVPAVWVPLAAYPLLGFDEPFHRAFLFHPHYCCVDLVGRLRAGTTRQSVEAELTALHRRFNETEPATPRGIFLAGTTGLDQRWSEAAVVIGLVMAGVGLVLVVACANVGNLQLARASQRQDEILVRLSLGASRRRIVRQLLTEGLLLACAAGALSIVCARVVAALAHRLPWTRWLAQFSIDVSPDWRVVAFGLALAASAVIATGLGPALRGTRRLVVPGRQNAGARTSARAWFLAAQMGLSAILLVGASLLGRGALVAASSGPGFDANNVAQINIRLPRGIPLEDRLDVVRARLHEALAPQAAFAEASSPVPPDASSQGNQRVLRNIDMSRHQILGQAVSLDYFLVLGVPLREGRVLRESDARSDVVINESLARERWPGESAVGRTLDGDSPRRVVGVVGDMRRATSPPAPTFFERGRGTLMYVRNDPGVLSQARAVVQAVEPRASVSFTPMSETFTRQLQGPRLAAAFAWGLGLASLGMAAVGIFGVFAFVVQERRREIGIRMALGADGRRIVGLMLDQAGRAMAIGLLVGFAAALLAAPLLRSYLIGIGPHDPIAYAAAVAVLTATALTATIVPVRRALRVDPASTLRAE
jgi:putative ABC transport system permease protein